MRGFVFLFLCLFLVGCSATIPKKQSINGISFVASNEAVNQKHIDPVIKVNANYASVMPFGFIRNLDSPEIIYSTKRQWYGETKEGAKQYIEQLQKNNIKIMLKPQLWAWRGEFTGDIEMQTEADWKVFEESYSKFIMDFAQVAQDTKAEILCIGTELEKFIENRPEYWKQLIINLKKVYKGKLTYAANWDEFKRTPFWADLDYIGIDAYFPVSEMQTPNVEDCKKGWQSHKALIRSYSEKYNKPILFTEFGYRSMDYTGKEPWQSDYKIKSLNLQGQTNATQALFEEFWNEDWFAGGFIWKWFHKHDKVGGKDDNQFTPQNKPAETIVREYYSLN